MVDGDDHAVIIEYDVGAGIYPYMGVGAKRYGGDSERNRSYCNKKKMCQIFH